MHVLKETDSVVAAQTSHRGYCYQAADAAPCRPQRSPGEAALRRVHMCAFRVDSFLWLIRSRVHCLFGLDRRKECEQAHVGPKRDWRGVSRRWTAVRAVKS